MTPDIEYLTNRILFGFIDGNGIENIILFLILVSEIGKRSHRRLVTPRGGECIRPPRGLAGTFASGGW